MTSREKSVGRPCRGWIMDRTEEVRLEAVVRREAAPTGIFFFLTGVLGFESMHTSEHVPAQCRCLQGTSVPMNVVPALGDRMCHAHCTEEDSRALGPLMASGRDRTPPRSCHLISDIKFLHPHGLSCLPSPQPLSRYHLSDPPRA